MLQRLSPEMLSTSEFTVTESSKPSENPARFTLFRWGTNMRFTALILTVLFAFEAHASLADRAKTYDNMFFPKGAPGAYLDEKINPSLKGLRNMKTVLPGVLYRGGGPGGMNPLSFEGLRSLCRAGFSLAFYTYKENFRDVGPVECTNELTGRPNTLHYLAGDVLDGAFKTKFLSRVQQVIQDPSRGPVFVHCWNGFHASGEYAAIALRQFCQWSADRASSYWLRHAGGYPLISRINRFTPHASLNVDDDARAVLCRQRR